MFLASGRGGWTESTGPCPQTQNVTVEEHQELGTYVGCRVSSDYVPLETGM